MPADDTAPPPVAALLDLHGRVAVVTGASGGIGAGIAARLAEAGAMVVVHHHLGRERAEALAATVGAGQAVVAAADLRDGAAAAGLASVAVDRFGRLDIWVNNAGVQPVAPLPEITTGDFDDVMAANLTAAANGTRAAAARMTDGGAIVNIASIEAIQPAAGHSHYAASKAAVVAHTKAAALELGRHRIRVNAVAPGLVDRPGLHDQWRDGVDRWMAACPLGRLGRPDDVADACLFLASPAARWITGAVLVVDGGVLSRPTW